MAASVLVLAYGNPARGDDGLGPALGQFLEERALPGVRVEINYQLVIEDAADMAKSDIVLFVDADSQGPEPYSFRRISLDPNAGVPSSFSSHSQSPAQVLCYCRDFFHKQPEAFLFGIRGYAFEMFSETLSAQAQANLEAAESFLEPLLGSPARPMGWENAPLNLGGIA